MVVRALCVIAVLVSPLCVSAEKSIDAFGPRSSAPDGGYLTETPASGPIPQSAAPASVEDLGAEVFNAGNLDPDDEIVLRSLREEGLLRRGPGEAGEGVVLAAADDLPKEAAEKNDSPSGGDNDLEDSEDNRIADPLYYWNVAMYHFNDKFYFWLLKPAAQGYSAVAPEPVRLAVSRFFANLTTPVRFAGNLLQFKFKNAGHELLRFVTNSTQGLAGFFDVAKSHYGIYSHDEDIGQTIGSYGIGHGFYLVWPFFGPSSLRDTVGLVGDMLLDPVTYVTPLEASVGIRAYDRVNETTFYIGDYEELKEAAIDPYVSIRNAYVQKRKKEVEE
jgi:phospholipid-binding lipoprotein MlaA